MMPDNLLIVDLAKAHMSLTEFEEILGEIKRRADAKDRALEQERNKEEVARYLENRLRGME